MTSGEPLGRCEQVLAFGNTVTYSGVENVPPTQRLPPAARTAPRCPSHGRPDCEGDLARRPDRYSPAPGRPAGTCSPLGWAIDRREGVPPGRPYGSVPRWVHREEAAQGYVPKAMEPASLHGRAWHSANRPCGCIQNSALQTDDIKPDRVAGRNRALCPVLRALWSVQRLSCIHLGPRGYVLDSSSPQW